jgi:hypothetical protein
MDAVVVSMIKGKQLGVSILQLPGRETSVTIRGLSAEAGDFLNEDWSRNQTLQAGLPITILDITKYLDKENFIESKLSPS